MCQRFFDAVDNQRYLLVSPKRFRGLNGFYVVPECFSKRKEDAQLFAKCMKPYIGAYDVVYTRMKKDAPFCWKEKSKRLQTVKNAASAGKAERMILQGI